MSQKPHGMSLTRLERLMVMQAVPSAVPTTAIRSIAPRSVSVIDQPVFGRLLPPNPVTAPARPEAHARIAELAASARGTAAVLPGPAAAGLTFFGQFVDHDVTLDVSSEFGKVIAPELVRNIRTPALDLDCVYGFGPEGSPLLYSGKHEGYLYMGNRFNPNDLPRNHEGRAVIGDPRNDENAIISQLQGLFIKFANLAHWEVEHNAAAYMGQFEGVTGNAYAVARQLVRWHYQWLIMHEMLPAFVDAAVLEEVMSWMRRNDLPKPFRHDSPAIPVEFAVAGYRFGHATVQGQYTLKNGTTIELFGNPQTSMPGLPAFGFKDPAFDLDLATMFDHPDPTAPGAMAAQRARPVGLDLTPEIFDLPFVMSGAIVVDGITFTPEQLKMLPARNLFRDRFTFQLASGQQMANAMGRTPLDRNAATKAARIDKIPLWYYVLQEGEEQANGKLGEVGGTLVATVLLRLLKEDPMSVWHRPWWKPVFGKDEAGRFSFRHMAAWVDANWGALPLKDDLVTPTQP